MLTIADILKATEGRLVAGSSTIEVKGVSIDSRTIKKGELFFAIKGRRFDGHNFVEEAVKKGAVACVVEKGRRIKPRGVAVIEVADTIGALGELARAVRTARNVPVIAVTGTNGKTTTKEMIRTMLDGSLRTLATPGNRNNTIGMPLTLLSMPEDCEVAVLELGINERGEMARLCHICMPTVGVVTNIGRAHTEGLGREEDVAEEKLTLFRYLEHGGIRVVNLDDPWIVKKEREFASKRVSFGRACGADVKIKDVAIEDEGLYVLYVVADKMFEIRYNSPLTHNAYNGAAAIAAAMAVGVDVEEAASRLNGFTPPAGRMRVVKIGGITVFDDTYNANPSSLRASLETLCGLPRRKIVVIGEMAELGESAPSEHKKAGKLAAVTSVDVLIPVGKYRMDVTEGAIMEGMKVENVYPARDNMEALSFLKNIVKEGDAVLIKGSRVAQTEEILSGLGGGRG